MVRCKFILFKVAEFSWGSAKELTFQATYDPSIPEDKRFAEATPSGVLTITVDNQAALAELQKGKAYYIDITPAE